MEVIHEAAAVVVAHGTAPNPAEGEPENQDGQEETAGGHSGGAAAEVLRQRRSAWALMDVEAL